MTREEKLARLTIARTSGTGPVKFLQMLQRFGSAKAFLKSNRQIKFKLFPESAAKPSLEVYAIDTKNTVVFGEAGYPDLLARITDPPIAFAYRGRLDLLGEPLVAIVGTRNNSQYGNNAAGKVATDLASSGYVVVSGLARGIDTIVHSAALASGGTTVAVIPTDITHPYPIANKKLFEQIAEKGLIISEIPNESTAEKYSFPRRNRIIAGLCQSTIVIEAPLKSGALITADLALSYDRDVYAVPAGIFSEAGAGSNKLLLDGKAQIYLGPEQITGAFRRLLQPDLHLKAEESETLELIGSGNNNFEQILKSAKITPAGLQAMLTRLELQGLIAKSVNGYYTLKT
jgi:DNA processing protein